MANERDEQKPRFQIIDNRMLSEEERSGSGPLIEVPGGAPKTEAPKLEIIGGGATKPEAGQAVSAPVASGDAADASETVPASNPGEIGEGDALSEAEFEQLQAEMEEEQFAQLEAEVGRALTEAEKTQVRDLMKQQAKQQAEMLSKLEVSPLLLQTVAELPRYAAVHMGLMPNPYTGLIARNDAEARLAIEAFSAMFDVMKNRTDARINQELSRVLNDLKTNFARITGQNIGPTGGPRIIR